MLENLEATSPKLSSAQNGQDNRVAGEDSPINCRDVGDFGSSFCYPAFRFYCDVVIVPSPAARDDHIKCELFDYVVILYKHVRRDFW